MKIKIVEAGWAGYTGHLGWTEFANGVSVEEVSHADARALAAVVQIEELDSDGEGTGKSPSVAQVILDTHGSQAVNPTLRTAESDVAAPAPAVVPERIYTEQELAEIADARGISGLREVADPLALKGKSIAELIGKILTAQGEIVAKAKAAEEAAAAAAAAAKEQGQGEQDSAE